jgi:hypothetical protein
MLINSITNLQLTRGVSFFFADTWRAASRLLRNSCWVDEERLDAAAVLLSCKPPRKGAVLADTCELLLVLQEEEVTEGPWATVCKLHKLWLVITTLVIAGAAILFN